MDEAVKCYNRQGKEITEEKFIMLHSDNDYKIVQKTDYHGVQVSTVWLGMDHAEFMPDADIVIFETMVFYDDDMVDEGDLQVRYRTEEEAIAGHREIVETTFPVKVLVNGEWKGPIGD